MLYVISSRPYEFNDIFEWRLGQTFRHRNLNVLSIEAEGAELLHIINHVKGIRNYELTNTVKWFGQDAIFIYHNVVLNPILTPPRYG